MMFLLTYGVRRKSLGFRSDHRPGGMAMPDIEIMSDKARDDDWLNHQ